MDASVKDTTFRPCVSRPVNTLKKMYSMSFYLSRRKRLWRRLNRVSEVSLWHDLGRDADCSNPSAPGLRPWIVQIDGHLDSVKRLMTGDVYSGRGSPARDLQKSKWSNPFEVAVLGRSGTQEFTKSLVAKGCLHIQVWRLSKQTL